MNFGPNFLEIGELRSRYFGTFKTSCKGLQAPKILWQSAINRQNKA